jgi:hypothetical protein
LQNQKKEENKKWILKDRSYSRDEET